MSVRETCGKIYGFERVCGHHSFYVDSKDAAVWIGSEFKSIVNTYFSVSLFTRSTRERIVEANNAFARQRSQAEGARRSAGADTVRESGRDGLRIAAAVLGRKSLYVHTTFLHCAHQALRGFCGYIRP